MIKTPTVFVLGAGASKPFGFPLGFELRDSVIAMMEGLKRRPGDFLELARVTQDHSLAFSRALKGSAQNSVDAFLEHRSEFMDIGKKAIAFRLILCETAVALYRDDNPNTNWLRYLLNKMRGYAFKEFAENRVAFITFNYDRSLEYFLGRALADSYDKNDQEIAEMMEKIPIVHLHGRLGYLPWQKRENARPYYDLTNSSFADVPTTEVLDMCAREIKVMHEGIDTEDDPEFKRAKSLLTEAQRVYFMGVGFNSLNLQRLGVDTLSSAKAASTCIGYDVQREFVQLTEQYKGRLKLYHNVGCIELLRNHVQWS